MESLGITGLTAVVLTGLVAGVVELIKRAFDKDMRSVITIVFAGLVGGLGALYFGSDFLTGVVFGLASSGFITIAQNVGKN
jgi:hypothetical protein